MDMFLYTVDQNADEPIMLINTFIGFDKEKGYGIMGNLFQKELLVLDTMGKKSIKVYINSPGGSVIDGYNIFNAILKSKTKVDTYCVGMAASIAGVIFQAGRNRVMADYSRLMYHNPYGTDNDKGLDTIKDSIITMITSRTGSDEDEVKKMMSKETWITPQEALDSKFCDSIEVSGEQNVKRSVATVDEAKQYWVEADTILNNLFKIKTETMTPAEIVKINNKLQLNPEASIEATFAEIDKIVNKAKGAAKEVEEAHNSVSKKEEELKSAKEKCMNLEKEVKDMKDAFKLKEKEDKEKDDSEMADKAKNMIASFVTNGTIKNEVEIVASWEAKAVSDFDGIKNLLDGMPLNKKAHKVDDVKNYAATPTGSVISSVMAGLYAKSVASN